MKAVYVLQPLETKTGTILTAIAVFGSSGKFQIAFHDLNSSKNFVVVGNNQKIVFSVHAGIASAVEAGLCAEAVKLADPIIGRMKDFLLLQTSAMKTLEEQKLARVLDLRNQDMERRLLVKKKRISSWAAACYWMACIAGIIFCFFVDGIGGVHHDQGTNRPPGFNGSAAIKEGRDQRVHQAALSGVSSLPLRD